MSGGADCSYGDRTEFITGGNIINGHDILSVGLFITRCGERGVDTREDELELLHRKGWLRPVAFGGMSDGIPNEALDHTRRRLWRERPDELQYEPWSNLKGDNGHFARPPWYSTAQIYLLKRLKSAFVIGLNVEEYERLCTGATDAQIEIAEAMRQEVDYSLADLQRNMPMWQRLAILLTEADLFRSDSLGEAIDEANRPDGYVATYKDDSREYILDYIATIELFFQDYAEAFVQRFAVSADELGWCHDRLMADSMATIGMLDPDLFLRYLPNWALYQSTGPMRLGLDMLRDSRIVGAIAGIGHGLKLIPRPDTCSECGKELPKVKRPGRPQTTCGARACVLARRARKQKERRSQVPR